MKFLDQTGNASVVIIFILIVIFSIYLAGGPSLLLSGESPKPEPSTTIPAGGATISPSTSPSASPSATVTIPPVQ